MVRSCSSAKKRPGFFPSMSSKGGRHFNNDVVTAVSIRFYVTDIVFFLDDPAERKAADGLKVGIDIIDKTTDNPNTNGII